jgi:hypothetical protein
MHYEGDNTHPSSTLHLRTLVHLCHDSLSYFGRGFMAAARRNHRRLPRCQAA